MSKEYIKYKGYYAKVEYSIDDKVLYGKIEGINDLVTFECNTEEEIETAFKEAVDDYLAYCADLGVAARRKYDANVHKQPVILRNAIRCKKCGDIIESTHVHDFKWCSCESVAVDGGHEYLHRIGNSDDIEELSIIDEHE